MPEKDEVYLVMSIMDTDLHRVIQSQQSLSDQHLRFFLHQLVKGLAFLHAHKYLHRDIKPGNLLVTKSCQLVITDFGLSRLMPQQQRYSSRRSGRVFIHVFIFVHTYIFIYVYTYISVHIYSDHMLMNDLHPIVNNAGLDQRNIERQHRWPNMSWRDGTAHLKSCSNPMDIILARLIFE